MCVCTNHTNQRNHTNTPTRQHKSGINNIERMGELSEWANSVQQRMNESLFHTKDECSHHHYPVLREYMYVRTFSVQHVCNTCSVCVCVCEMCVCVEMINIKELDS